MRRLTPHILVVIAVGIALLTGWQSALRNVIIDARFASHSRQATGNIVVVAIDALSIEKVGVWPWPRSLHGDLLRQLNRGGAQDVAFDIDFSSPSTSAGDKAFADALRQTGGSAVLPAFKQPGPDGSLRVNRPLKEFAENSWPAVVNVSVDGDGLVRRYPFGETLESGVLPSMSAVLAGAPHTDTAQFLIDFSIRPASIPVISYVDVLRGDPAALAQVAGRKVIVGATALELGDRFSIPNGRVIAGPFLQALAAESILQGRTLRWTSNTAVLIWLAALALLMAAMGRRVGAVGRGGILIGSAIAVELGAACIQLYWPVVLDTSLFHIGVLVYLVGVALDEIDLRGLLSRIAEHRFHRIAMSLGDGLVCTDENHLITVWNPGASAIFGYLPDEILGRGFDELCARNPAGRSFAIRDVVRQALLVPGGAVIVEFEGRRKNGEVFSVEASFSGWQGTDGFQYGAILRDISERKREAARIKYLAEYDSLTGLANRNTLVAQLSGRIGAAEHSGRDVALFVLGLDGFEQINDMLGHAAGDLLLHAVGQRLTDIAGQESIVARLSGDEFAIVSDGGVAGESAGAFAERLLRAFEEPVGTDARQHRVKLSIGVASYPEAGRTPDDLLSNAHLALCRAKAIRRGGYVAFEDSIRTELEARLKLETELGLAVERNEFELFYQPQILLVDNKVVGAEALIRWRHPERGYVSPAEFMPIVNTSALSDRIAQWVMETACTQARSWELAGTPVRVAINLSPSQLHSTDLAASVSELLRSTGLSPSLLEVEVTEDILLVDEARVLETFRRIQSLGVRLLFDDFGTGYASLSYLKKFPLDGLKIDRTFVMDLLRDSDDAAIVSSTIGLSKQLGLSVIAEGIEDRATADFLISMGCEEGQGYFFGRPMPAPAFEAEFLAGKPEADAIGSGNVAA